MPNFNQVTLVGHLTKNPELSYLQNQTAVCNFGIAVNDKYKAAGGELNEKVLFIDCVLFGKRGEAVNKHLHKGDPILVTGKLVLDKWKDNEELMHYKHKIHVQEFKFMSSKKQDKGESDD